MHNAFHHILIPTHPSNPLCFAILRYLRVLQAWELAHDQMLYDLRDRLPHKILLLNDHTRGIFPSPGFEHEYESFRGSDTQIEQLQNDSQHHRLATAHNEGDFNTSLVAFLLGAGDYAYLGAPFQVGQILNIQF